MLLKLAKRHPKILTIATCRCNWLPLLLALLTIISGVTTAAHLDLARADDCLAAPNSPAPKGSHWYYHLNRATQQKCWYVRSVERQPQDVTVQTSSDQKPLCLRPIRDQLRPPHQYGPTHPQFHPRSKRTMRGRRRHPPTRRIQLLTPPTAFPERTSEQARLIFR